MAEQDIREIESITFGVFSTQEILKMSVCLINNPKLGGVDKTGGAGTVYDGRMGTIENGRNCETCEQDVWKCPGHPGHIEFNEPIIHPLFYKQVVSFLKCFCIKCFRLLINRDQIYVERFNRFKGNLRFVKILEKLEKVDICYHCDYPQPEIKFLSSDSTISMIYKQRDSKMSIILAVDEIKKTFDNIENSDIMLLGFDPVLVHPKNFIMTVFPVLPQCCRPYVITDGHNPSDDDLTNQIVEIIKANNHLAPSDDLSETKRQKSLQSLKFRVLTFYNNCVSPETPIPLWDGSIKRADEIVTGDIIIGDDGRPRTILSTCSGEDEMYEVTQQKGDTYRVNSNHILTLEFYRKNKHVTPLVIDISIQEYMKLQPNIKCCLLGFKLGCSVEWDKKEVNLDPYILGLWLGNGDVSGKGFTSEDTILTEYWKDWCIYNDSEVIQHPYKDTENIYFEIKNIVFENQYISPLKKILEQYNLVNNKYIPQDYIINDKNIRLQVLAGLIDSIGFVSENKILIFQNDLRVLKDALFIARSLGIQARILSKNCYCIFKGVEKLKIGYVLYLSGEAISQIPILVERKRCQSVDVLSSYINVKPVGIGKYNGFTIDGNNRFILGDFTVTHNSQGKAKHSTNGRPIKGLKERMTGKEGQIRTNLMGKRVDQSGRTVIGPDPTLKMGQLAVPIEMAEILTVPITVCNFNIDMMTKVVNEGRANFVIKSNGASINLKRALYDRGTQLKHGDILIRKDKEIVIHNGKMILQVGDLLKRKGSFVENLKYPSLRKYNLTIGDVVERKLINGDIVLLNRQPTLHKASMMAQEVVIRPYKTLRMNLAITKPFNADFDGDEMNIHVPQTLEAREELKMLSASKHMIISAQASKPNMSIVQDSLLGAYIMTKGNQKMRKDQFFDISMKLEMSSEDILSRIQHIRRILKEKGKKTQCFNGKGLVSLILPDDLIYEKMNGADSNEPIVKIYRGVMYEGVIDKSIIGASHNSLIQIIYKEYGVDAASNFIDGIQFVTNSWLMIYGFSVGIEDCLIQGDDKEQEIADVIQKCLIEAEGIKTTTTHKGIRELRINAALNKAKDIGLRIAKDALASDNKFLATVNSGSKGDFFNIAQITGLLGQQNLKGARVVPVLNHGKRTLPHYAMDNLTVEDEYESRGFVASSFIQGLNPKQFYFHAMSGREGICDTAMGTSTSGYMQRRIVKLTEDIKSQYDGTVRDAVGKVYQLAYGEDNLDPTETVKVSGSQEMCDISRLVAKLNMKHEIEEDKLRKKLKKVK